jgi:hypothetical protein
MRGARQQVGPESPRRRRVAHFGPSGGGRGALATLLCVAASVESLPGAAYAWSGFNQRGLSPVIRQRCLLLPLPARPQTW